jgi:hypothetical protein
VKLITAHRILIGVGIAFFLFYAAVQLRMWARAGEAGALVQAVGSVSVALGLLVYFRTLRGWGRR